MFGEKKLKEQSLKVFKGLLVSNKMEVKGSLGKNLLQSVEI